MHFSKGCGPIQEDKYGNVTRQSYSLAAIKELDIQSTSTNYVVRAELIGGGCLGFLDPTYNVKNSEIFVEFTASNPEVIKSSADPNHQLQCLTIIELVWKELVIPRIGMTATFRVNGVTFDAKGLPIKWQNPDERW